MAKYEIHSYYCSKYYKYIGQITDYNEASEEDGGTIYSMKDILGKHPNEWDGYGTDYPIATENDLDSMIDDFVTEGDKRVISFIFENF